MSNTGDYTLNKSNVPANSWLPLPTVSPELIDVVDAKDEIAERREGCPPSFGGPSSAPTASNSQKSDEGMESFPSLPFRLGDPASVGKEVIAVKDLPAVGKLNRIRDMMHFEPESNFRIKKLDSIEITPGKNLSCLTKDNASKKAQEIYTFEEVSDSDLIRKLETLHKKSLNLLASPEIPPGCLTKEDISVMHTGLVRCFASNKAQKMASFKKPKQKLPSSTKGEPVGHKGDYALNKSKVTANGWLPHPTVSPELIDIVDGATEDNIAKGGDCNEIDSSDEGYQPSSECPSSAPTAPNSQESDKKIGTLQSTPSEDPASVAIEVISVEMENISMDNLPAVKNSDASPVRKSMHQALAMKQLDPEEETLKKKESGDNDEEDEIEGCDELKEADVDGEPDNPGLELDDFEIIKSPTHSLGEDENPITGEVPVGDVSSMDGEAPQETKPVFDLDAKYRLINEKESTEFKGNVFQNIEQAKVNERVRIWLKAMSPFLNNINTTEKFDIYLYGCHILYAFKNSNGRQTMPFKEICQGKEEWEVHRLLMALLPLANMGCVELANGPGKDGEEDKEIMVTLLSRKPLLVIILKNIGLI